MGKYLWRKHSYVRVEDDHPGCLWTIFHMLNYHPWNNVRKMLPYKKHKLHGKAYKNRGIMPEEEDQIISRTHELEDDSILKYSASVNSNTSTNGSRSKRSIKARIRALMKEKTSSTKSDLIVNGPKNKGHKGKLDDDNNASTLLDLLKANPKLLRSASRIDDSNNIRKPETKDSKKKDEFMGVLELFNVDHGLFIKILQDTSPTKLRLVKSGTFPSRNSANFGTTPSKVEHKHKEVWPVSNNVHELQKAKSQGVLRSSSLTESLGKFGYLFDTSSNKAIKKHLAKSSKSMNEKEFVIWGDLQSPRTAKERLDLPVSEPHSFSTTAEPLSRAISERENNKNGVQLLKLESTNGCEKLIESQSEEKATWYIFEEEQDCQVTNDNVELNEGEIQMTDYSISEELQVMPNITSTSFTKLEDSQGTDDQFSMDYNNQDLEYVKHVLDVVGFATLEDQHEALHSRDQQLDPALFDMIEVCCPFEPKSSNKVTNSSMSSSHHKLLFDLINEALLDIHEKTYTYYPKALSFWCQVHPMGKQKAPTSEEVWEFVEYLSWRPELDPSLDLAVANDLSRHKNGWINLQMDTEGLALELEDCIFDDLLDEIVD